MGVADHHGLPPPPALGFAAAPLSPHGEPSPSRFRDLGVGYIMMVDNDG